MGQLIGTIQGAADQEGQDVGAINEQEAMLAALKGMAAPSIAEEQLNPQDEQVAGNLTPEQESALKQQSTSLNNVSVSPALRAAEMQALQSLQQQGQTGLTASDRQALQQISQQNAQQANSENQAVLQGAAQRGMGGSGASLAAQLSNNQNSANNAQNRSMSVASQAQQNALNATAQSGQLGSQMEGQQYGEASNAAKAQDAINQFNTANAQNVGNTNVQSGNQAQAYNLQNAQNVGNYNTQAKNQAQQYNSGLYQQQYADQLAQQQAATGEANSLAGNQFTYGTNKNTNDQAIGKQADNTLASFVGGMAQGGMVHGYDQGGDVGTDDNESDMPSEQDSGSASASASSSNPLGGFFNKLTSLNSSKPTTPQASAQAPSQQGGLASLQALLGMIKGGGSSSSSPMSATSSNNFGAQQLQMPQLGQGSGMTSSIPAMAQGGMVPFHPVSLKMPAIKSANFKASPQNTFVAQRPARLFNEGIGSHVTNYAEGGEVQPRETVQDRMEALQRGAGFSTPQKSGGTPFDASKYVAPKSMDDAEDDAQNQAQYANMAQQLVKFQAANNMPTDNSAPNPSTQNYMGGGKVKGKEVVKGDSPKNDNVRAKLSAGEIVLPKSIVESSDEAVLAFIKAAKGGK